MLEASSQCLNLIRVSEGLKLNPYQDVAGYFTVGYGHKLGDNEAVIGITYQQAEAYLLSDVMDAEKAVNALTGELMVLTQGMFDALVSFTFNLGAKNLAESTLLAKLRGGNIIGAADEFLRWDRSGGKAYPGLLTRRQAERSMFLSGMPLTGAS